MLARSAGMRTASPVLPAAGAAGTTAGVETSSRSLRAARPADQRSLTSPAAAFPAPFRASVPRGPRSLAPCALDLLCYMNQPKLRKPASTRPYRKSHVRQVRHPLRPLDNAAPAYRRGPHGALQLALCQNTPAGLRCCCASRTRTAKRVHRGRDRRDPRRLSWLGLAWDGEAVSQFERSPRHREVAEELVRLGARPITPMRPRGAGCHARKARAEGRPPRYDGTGATANPAEAPEGVRGAIRIKARNRRRRTVVHDLVQGEVRFPNKDLDDFIILRSVRQPHLHPRRVVDDHRHGRHQHIIRGDDHLHQRRPPDGDLRRQGWQVPKMAPNPAFPRRDGAKLSKRHGALGVEAYRAMGYLSAGSAQTIWPASAGATAYDGSCRSRT